MKLLKNISITLSASVLSNGATALAGLLVANTAGARGAGTFALVRIVPTVVATLLGSGLQISNAYLVGSRKYPVEHITETTAALGVLASVFGWAGWGLCSGFIRSCFFSHLSATTVVVVGLSVPFQILRNNFVSIQQGLQTFTEANVVLFAEDFAVLLLVLPLLIGCPATSTIVMAAIGGSALSCFASVYYLMREGFVPWPWLHRAIAAESIRFGLKWHIGRVANTLNWRLDVMILSAMTSVEVVGWYAVATKMAEVFRPVAGSLNFVLRPLVASLPAEEAQVQGIRLFRRASIVNLVAVAIMALVGGPFITHVFGVEFAPAIPAFEILLVGLAWQGADGVLNGYYVGIGRPELTTYAALFGLIITLVGNVTLIPRYSLMGAAVTSAFAYSAKAAALTAFFLSMTGATFPQLVGLKEYNPA